ncbi:Leucine-rich repeat and guanylate kinase domain-containing protein [Apodemus speciosus]|uniref:Leucine-rich repeat and guanylate kinase domain-containing protein n=1 Tax=Apodemus speciosus TaxID=105296 RepID=A0ABQ0EUE7_APOSI
MGPVPIPTVSGQQYFATIDELQKTFELCDDHFKTPFGPYPETSKDSNISNRYSTLFHTCPWSKELPFQLPEGGVSSRPGSAGSDEVDGALKGSSCSIISAGKSNPAQKTVCNCNNIPRFQHQTHPPSNPSRPQIDRAAISDLRTQTGAADI